MGAAARAALLRHVQRRRAHTHRTARRAPAAPRAMQTAQLGASELQVSRMGIGTMTFGERNTYDESARLLSMAVDGGVTFIDSAEMYPVPQRAETQGRSEEYLGRWLRSSRCRDRVVLSTKVAGPAAMSWLRGGPLRLDAAGIRAAAEASLLRLGVDCIDLLSLHWPDRYVPMFGDVAFDAAADYGDVEPIGAQLEALAALVAEGKVRAVGLSNETPWGLMRFLAAAEARPGGAPRVVALQNAFSLTCRGFEAGLAECCFRERVSLVAYSPLAMGLLTGKYCTPGGGGARARLNLYAGRYAEAEGRYSMQRPRVRDAVDAYVQLAARHGMAPAALALRFAAHAPGVACALTGATEEGQMAQLLAAACDGPLPEHVLAEVDALHERFASPTP